jgi:hypothetical protein
LHLGWTLQKVALDATLANMSPADRHDVVLAIRADH